MLLFTKPECSKCHDVKRLFDLGHLGVREEILGPDNPEALAELAFYECVELAERELPILVTAERQVFSGVIPIKKFLRSFSGTEA